MRDAAPTLLALALLVMLAATAVPLQAAEPRDNLLTLNSLRTDSTALDGHVVYVDFWASWCPPCRQSFPWMTEQQDKYAQRGLRVVGVSVDKDHKDALNFLKKADPQFEIVFDSTGSLAKAYGLEAMPTSYIYGRDGKLRYTHQGFTTDEEREIDSVMRALLDEEAPK